MSKSTRLSLALVCLAGLAAGCSDSHSRTARAPRYYGSYGQPQPAGGLPVLQNRPVAVGSAFTAFGPLFDQIPQLRFPLPPLPGGGGSPVPTSGPSGGGFPGGFPFPLPFPTTGGQGGGAGNGLPLPIPWPNPAPGPNSSQTDDWPAQWSAWEEEVLARTNATRARGVVCGGQSMPPAPPVSLNGSLRTAARRHSKDMADRNYFEHENPEGAGPADRAQAAGFSSTFVGENIAAGQTSPERVVQAWIDSPGHCVNMMDPRYKVLGVGYYFDANSDKYGHYWTQDFGG